MIIAHPPCDHLAVSGAAHFAKKRESGVQEEGLKFFLKFLEADCDKIVIENPVNILSGEYCLKYFPELAKQYNLPRKPTQYIQPYEFGEPTRKKTGLWIKGVKALQPTNIVEPELIEYVDKNGENKIIYADDLNNIVIPDGCRQAKVTYYTEYTNASAAGNTSYENLVSIVIGSNTWTSYASVDIKGVAPSIKKEHVSTGKDKDGKITYKISSTVPSGMDKTGLFYLKDTLTIDLSKVEKNVWNKPENISIKIDGAEYVDENALSVTIKRLRDKLGAQDYIKTVYGIGYTWVKKNE